MANLQKISRSVWFVPISAFWPKDSRLGLAKGNVYRVTPMPEMHAKNDDDNEEDVVILCLLSKTLWRAFPVASYDSPLDGSSSSWCHSQWGEPFNDLPDLFKCPKHGWSSCTSWWGVYPNYFSHQLHPVVEGLQLIAINHPRIAIQMLHLEFPKVQPEIEIARKKQRLQIWMPVCSTLGLQKEQFQLLVFKFD